MINEMSLWCIVMAGRENIPPAADPARINNGGRAGVTAQDPLAAAVRRARGLSTPETLGAVVTDQEFLSEGPVLDLARENIFVEPQHRGTAYEVMFVLLNLSMRVSPETPMIFLPSDHVVREEEVVTRSLLSMIEWMRKDPLTVYLLGAAPEGPHNQLGYIVPWYDSMQVPAGVYEFVEEPDMRQARKLIGAGGLWNTFIFGGTLSALLGLFSPRFDQAMDLVRQAIGEAGSGVGGARSIAAIYQQLTPADLSRDVLTPQTQRLNVLRMPRCGWWPLKPPKIASNIERFRRP
jgi:mannose-1-phosphate guanylyltransferase